ncbi:DUF2752 domain-containing protein [Fulvivirga sedimenti]|uniref:DUF2752 domain-containing protein n=1 Tax=Fulvivirga sedimenti TaxID=2879465 RepID=A0A9X1HQU2_9BACT|nr:DUF2752 domain-containing protein [Fulvivirga sedimenti]MCA6075535.1 DUF2752 domain-containing protein [Fulvivirga sedimenti]MCA6076712.1 DUF2752 domain-containing protein [Fulvivirga sedimenti]MCA6077840.1 DUF2752 domain-containing protein [Fulvivirga sedimenti]
MNRLVRHKAFPEAYIWITALAVLAFINPGNNHWTLCPLANIGIDFCPGCGLGRGISHLLHGEWSQSWNTHPLSFLAAIILVHRIIRLFSSNKPLTTTTYGKSNRVIS